MMKIEKYDFRSKHIHLEKKYVLTPTKYDTNIFLS